MKWILFKNINLDVYYYGNKIIKPVVIKDNYLKLSNNDVIKFKGNELYFNNQLISNLEDITEEEVYELYISRLKKKGYKFLN